MDGVDHDTIPCCLRRGCRRGHAVGRVEQTLIVAGIMLFVEASGQTEIRQLDVSVLVYEDVVRFNITERALSVMHMVMLVPLTGE